VVSSEGLSRKVWEGGLEETFLKSFLQESGRYDTIIEMAKRIHFLNSLALGLPLLETVDKSRHIGDELRCHRGYKPLLLYHRSGDLPGYGNSAQSEPATSASLKETVETVKSIVVMRFGAHHTFSSD
jgi:hypothetical protein